MAVRQARRFDRSRRGPVRTRRSTSERARAMEPPETAVADRDRSSDHGAAASLHEAAQPPQVVDDRIHAVPMDELHGIVVHSLVLTHAVDRHDVAVVQPRRRARLELEPLELGGCRAARSGRGS